MKQFFTFMLTAFLFLFTIPNLQAQTTWGDNNSRTEWRDNAGLRGDAGAMSGFYQSVNPVNYPAGAQLWWHLLDVRHTNPGNNYAMQFSGSFYDQNLYFRKTNDNAAQAWSRVLLETDGKVGIGTTNPVSDLDIHKPFTGSGLYEASTIGLSTDNSSNSWTLGAVTGYVAAAQSNGMAGYPGGLLFKTKNPDNDQNSVPTTKMVIDANGNVGIGTTNPDAKLTVNGTVHSKEVKVDLNVPGPDYVFEKDYKLKSLAEVQKYITENKHLPEIPSAKVMEQNGVDLSNMNMQLLKKVEELTLYLIEKDKQFGDQLKKDRSFQLQLKEQKRFNLLQQKYLEQLQQQIAMLKGKTNSKK